MTKSTTIAPQPFITAEAREIARCMKIINSVIKQRNTIPILGYVRIFHDKKGLHFQATNLDMCVTVSADAMDYGGGLDICVNAQYLTGIAKAAGSSTPMRIEKSEDIRRAKITLGDHAFYEVHTLPSADFPAIHGGNRGEVVETFTNGFMASSLAKVAHCISDDEFRYYLMGVAWQRGYFGSRFVAINGHKLAACHYAKEAIPDNGEASGRHDRIIHSKTVKFIMTHLRNADVAIYATESYTVMDYVAPGIVLRSKLIDGTFPDWLKVLPKDHDSTLHLRKSAFVKAVHQAMACPAKHYRAIIFDTSADGNLVLRHKNEEFGKATIETDVKWPENAQPIGMNSQYLLDIIKDCGEEIRVTFSDPMYQMAFHDADDTMTRILMPMRI